MAFLHLFGAILRVMQVELVTNIAEEARCRLSGTHAVEYELRLVCTRKYLFRDEMSNYVLYNIVTSESLVGL